MHVYIKYVYTIPMAVIRELLESSVQGGANFSVERPGGATSSQHAYRPSYMDQHLLGYHERLDQDSYHSIIYHP